MKVHRDMLGQICGSEYPKNLPGASKSRHSWRHRIHCYIISVSTVHVSLRALSLT